MKIGRKLALGFFVAALCIWVTSLFAMRTLTNVHNEFELLKEDILPGAIAMAEMNGATAETAHLLMHYMSVGKEKYIEQIGSTMKDIERQGLIHRRHETHIGLEEQKAADELLVEIKRFISASEKIINLKQQGADIGELLKIADETIHPVITVLIRQFKEHKAGHIEELAEAEEAVLNAYSSGMQFLLLSLVIITFLSIAISFFITRSIVKPIHTLHKGTEIIGNGNLDYKVGTDLKDEIGQLSRAFDEMSEKLKKSTTSIVNLNKEISERRWAEEALRESEEKYRNIFSSVTDTLLIFDYGGNIVEANPRAREMYGYSYKEMMWLTVKDLMHPDYFYLFGKFKKNVDEMGAFYSESVDVRKDGSAFSVEIKGGCLSLQGKASFPCGG